MSKFEVSFGGDGWNRTRVRKCKYRNFYERSSSNKFLVPVSPGAGAPERYPSETGPAEQGLFSPGIEIKGNSRVEEKYENENSLAILFKDTYMLEDFSLDNLMEHHKVHDAEVNKYQDGLGVNHVMVVIEFNEEVQFTGTFEEVERTTFIHDFYLAIE